MKQKRVLVGLQNNFSEADHNFYHQSWKRIFTLLLCAFFLSSLMTLSSVPSNAATMGSGFHGNPIPGLQLPHLGNWITPEGTRAYCIEPGRNNPVSSQHAPVIVDSFPAYTTSSLGHSLSIPRLDGLKLAQINYIVNTFGNTANNAQAAAVQMAIWILRSTPEAYLKEFYSVSAFSGTPSYQTSRNRAQSYIDQAQAAVATLPISQPKVELDFPNTEPHKNEAELGVAGKLTLQSAGWTGKSKLTGATVSAAPTTVQLTNSGNATHIDHNGLGNFSVDLFGQKNLTSGHGSQKYTVHVETTLEAFTAQAYMHASTTSSQQRLMSAAPKQTKTLSKHFTHDGHLFEPLVNTHVKNKQLQPGDTPIDLVTFMTESPENEENGWLVDDHGRLLPIRARATLYYSEQFIEESQDIPSYVEMIYTDLIDIDFAEGINSDYEIVSNTSATKAGYYSWVIEIFAEDQPTWVQEYLPNGYQYSSGIGIPNETHILPMELSIHTRLDQHVIAQNTPLVDEVNIKLEHGPWIKDASGEPIKVNFNGQIFQIQDSPEFIEILPEKIPTFLTLNAATTSPETFFSEQFIPTISEGFITIQWCINEDQPLVNAGYCDIWGDPNETAEIITANFYTQATKSASVGERIHDDLFIEGLLPYGEHSVRFSAYLLPEEFENNSSDLADQCLDTHLIFESNLLKINPEEKSTSTSFVVPDNVHFSESHHKQHTRQILWIAEIFNVENDTIYRGECGDPNEITTIFAPLPTLAESGISAHSHGLTLAATGFILLGLTCFGGTRLRKLT